MEEDENLGAALKALYAVFGETPFSAGQVRESQDDALQAALKAAVGPRRDSTVLGWLKRHVLAASGGYRLRRVGGGFGNGRKAFYVERDHGD